MQIPSRLRSYRSHCTACRLFRTITVLLAAAIGFSSLAVADSAPNWTAGIAKKKITPAEPMWMSGYASRTRPAEGTLHELWAKALIVQDADGNQHAFVSLDLVGIGRDISTDVCKALEQKCGLQRSQVSLFTSHTHTGPVVGGNLGSMYFVDEAQQKKIDGYADFLKSAIVEVVQKALNDRHPVSISYGMGNAGFAVNRRNNREADVPQLREQGELKGPVDHSVPVLAVRSSEGKLEGIVFGYACHATVLSFYQWSGDWPGFAQLEIEKAYPGVTALFMAGCGADQNPLPRRTVELAESYGVQTRVAVQQVLEQEMKSLPQPLQAVYEEIPLKLGKLPSRGEIEKNLTSSNRYEVARAKQLLKKIEKDGQLDQTYPYPIQIVGFGDQVRLVVLGGEVVVDYSNRLRREFDRLDLWVAGYANDVMAYIPSVRVLKEGGYEGASSMVYYGLPTVWSEQVEEQIVSTVHRLIQQLAAKSSTASN